MFFATLLALAAVQDAPPPQDPPVPADTTANRPETDKDGTQRWSILVDPCASVTGNQDDIVVCGAAAAGSPRLPLPAERGPPDRPVPGNPYLSGSGALASVSAPCATRSEGCTTGINLLGGATTLVRLIGKVVDPGSCCETPGEASNPFQLIGRASCRERVFVGV